MPRLKIRFKINVLTQSAMFAAILCLLCPLAIPVGPVPVTLGVFAVLFTGIVLHVKQAMGAVAAYLLIGFIGIPVFSAGGCGPGVFVGPTGGYLWCFLPMAALVSWLSDGGDWPRAALAGALAVLLCYIIGTMQFIAVTDARWQAALSMCVWPFVPFDIIKIILAAVLGVRIRRRLRQAGLI